MKLIVEIRFNCLDAYSILCCHIADFIQGRKELGIKEVHDRMVCFFL